MRDSATDGCMFCPKGVNCQNREHAKCVRCGWFPAEAKRRKLERLAAGKITIRKGGSE